MPFDDNLETKQTLGPAKGDFVAPANANEVVETVEQLPEQEAFYKPPVRFGSVPVESEPLGWDRRKGYRKLYPALYLPFQVVERVSFGHPELAPNQLYWGDNLHVMRQLPSESIDLMYIDPPFFSGKQYNVIFGDQNELRSFSDIWEAGMPGYLIWLNARLYEMKRLLKSNGSIFVHCDWHASHYIKTELDRIFGYSNFRNEIIWHYEKWTATSRTLQKNHDIILFYSKSNNWNFNIIKEITDNLIEKHKKGYLIGGGGGSEGLVVYDRDNPDAKRLIQSGKYKVVYADPRGKPLSDVFRIPFINPVAKERIGYPTQKPEQLLAKIIEIASNKGDLIADFFSGGGTTSAVAQRLERRWIACDQSRVAVALTADRITRQVEEQTGKLFAVPDFTISHWGIYESKRLAAMPAEQFRGFILSCYGATASSQESQIHGDKKAVPVWVGDSDPAKGVTARDVLTFANAIRRTLRYQQDNLREGIMLAWAFQPDAAEAAERLRRLEQTDLNFVRLEQVRIDSSGFRTHVASLSTDHADYASFLTFIQPPRIEVGWKRTAPLAYLFDVSDTMVMNANGKIINVQWDFDYDKRFSSTPGFSFTRGANKEPQLQAEIRFAEAGTYRIACKVQDDLGGEGLWTGEMKVN